MRRITCATSTCTRTRGEKGVCDLERVEHSISYESTRRGSKDVLEAVFAVKVEAGDRDEAIIHSVTE